MKKYILIAILLAGTATAFAQTFARGQDISPTFDGWEQNADGTYTFYFGYYNRNADEDFDVPIGPDNNVDGGDRGQPTHFYPSRKWWVFKVVVPADWPKDRRLTWTLTTKGRTNQAKAWLQPEWEVDQELIAKNAARDPSLMTASSNEVDTDHDNRPPAITGSAAQTVSLPNPLTLTATATDDGRPRETGVRLRWIVYRGPGRVRLEPDIMSGRVYGKPATLATQASFSTPGAYRVRVIASDGQAFSTYDVDVTVK
jgi:hypothetical protein